MASVVVDLVLEKLGGMLIEEISKGVSLFCNLRSDFQWLSKKLTKLRDYLRDADAQSAHKASVNKWLLEVEDIARDAEDILDECAVQSKGTNNESPQSSCVCAFSYSQLVFRYKMARRIKDVKDRMRSIMEDAAELKLVGDVTHADQPSTSTPQNFKWRGSSVIETASRPVAIESKVQDVVRLLDDPAAPVIAVVGMGGVGKTFLLQNAFDRAKGRFEQLVWLAISQTYSLEKLQGALASKIGVNEVLTGRIDEVHAAQLIHERLTSITGRFLIVLDDVWRATGQDNLISALGLPTGDDTHCKIVVTTRSKHVCRNMNAHVYELHPLSEEESWDLFCAFAMPNWIWGFSNLMQLELRDCHCAEYPALQMMPNLIKLEIWTNDICKALPKGFGKCGGFRQLCYFRIVSFLLLEEFPELEDGAMPHLQVLEVEECSNLNKIPRGLELLKCLKRCDFKQTGVDDMLEEGGELWEKIKANNPNVIINIG
ncbi:hypothetical protein SUGI_0367100 [Cryptomeria japonica]|uniref:disease resistance RPP13-like protein 4 n=1 Tax=Cryptomeria japonica TaxID=3369 RepID=UPI002408B7FE|nr:disease resistance RPP13-like protein 4 [Cryptomeria japonica]GLJ20227.1 hypothetical protein SUGI_0367100 [Cryptomeria japonica]